ncbi:MAG: filamentous hemagglutinin N-terminal domain-containing protein [Cyanobacteria bacterium P01_G01_bin.38]
MVFPVDCLENFCSRKSIVGFGTLLATLGLSSTVYGQVTPDNISPTNSIVSSTDATNFVVDGGLLIDGNQLHRFSSFSIPTAGSVTFDGTSVQNIFSLVTGNSVSDVGGAIKAIGGANFFLINPNGIIFGPNASLEIGGSFLASTAEDVLFPNGEQFSATQTPMESPLLSISMPIGLQFGNIAGPIINRSNASPAGAVNFVGDPVGLSVQPNQTIAFIGNELLFEGGNLTTPGGHIELGSVAPDSIVSIVLLDQRWILDYQDEQNFHDIRLSQESILDASGSGGSLNARGHNIEIANRSGILNFTLGAIDGGDVVLQASESVELLDDLSGIFFTVFPGSTGNGGNLLIEAQRLVLQDGAVISGGTSGSGAGGELLINASESVELFGTGNFAPTLITSSTDSPSNGGNLTINTAKLTLLDGAQVQAATFGVGQGGTLTVNASEFIEVNGIGSTLSEPKLSSGLFASSGVEGFALASAGNGGDLRLNTNELTLQNEAQVSVNSLDISNAGNLTIDANRVWLDNRAQITAEAASGNGGNLRLQNVDTLLLRNNSLISTTAGFGNGDGNGGNIDIDARFIITLPNGDTDIIANAVQGRGGNINIASSGLLGIAPRRAVPGNGTNDIDASSEFGFDGEVAIEQPLSDEAQGLVELTNGPLESSSLVVSQCGDLGNNQFVLTGRGGIPINPGEISEAERPLVDLGQLESQLYEQSSEFDLPEMSEAYQLLEAQGWYADESGDIVLTADVREASPSVAALPYANCHGRFS